MRLEGRLAVVTGASSGIGEALSKELARRGARVVLLARGREALERVATAIRSTGGVAHPFSVDLSDARALAGVAQEIRATLGVPDVVVNNAGAGRWLTVEETGADEAVAMMAIPYFAAFFTTREFLAPMRARGTGTVVVVNSPVSRAPWPGAAGYAAARWALRGLVGALRADLGGTRLTVLEVIPGKVSSPYFANNPGVEERVPRIAKLIPTLTPDEVASRTAEAIERGRRELFFPAMVRIVCVLARVFPGLTARLLAY